MPLLKKAPASTETSTVAQYTKVSLNNHLDEKVVHIILCCKLNGTTLAHSAYRSFLKADAVRQELENKKENMLNGNKFYIEQIPFFE